MGGTYERIDDSRNIRSEALHHRKRQAEKVAIWHGGHGSHSDGSGGNDDSTVIGKTLPSAAFRFLAKVGDNRMKMQIVKIGFGGKL